MMCLTKKTTGNCKTDALQRESQSPEKRTYERRYDS